MMNIPPQVRPFLEFLYGDDKWWRIWAMILTVCVVFLIPKGTRRLAGISFVTLFCVMFIWNYLQTSYAQFTPKDPYATATDTTKKKKYLH